MKCTRVCPHLPDILHVSNSIDGTLQRSKDVGKLRSDVEAVRCNRRRGTHPTLERLPRFLLDILVSFWWRFRHFSVLRSLVGSWVVCALATPKEPEPPLGGRHICGSAG